MRTLMFYLNKLFTFVLEIESLSYVIDSISKAAALIVFKKKMQSSNTWMVSFSYIENNSKSSVNCKNILTKHILIKNYRISYVEDIINASRALDICNLAPSLLSIEKCLPNNSSNRIEINETKRASQDDYLTVSMITEFYRSQFFKYILKADAFHNILNINHSLLYFIYLNNKISKAIAKGNNTLETVKVSKFNREKVLILNKKSINRSDKLMFNKKTHFNFLVKQLCQYTIESARSFLIIENDVFRSLALYLLRYINFTYYHNIIKLYFNRDRFIFELYLGILSINREITIHKALQYLFHYFSSLIYPILDIDSQNLSDKDILLIHVVKAAELIYQIRICAMCNYFEYYGNIAIKKNSPCLYGNISFVQEFKENISICKTNYRSLDLKEILIFLTLYSTDSKKPFYIKEKRSSYNFNLIDTSDINKNGKYTTDIDLDICVRARRITKCNISYKDTCSELEYSSIVLLGSQVFITRKSNISYKDTYLELEYSSIILLVSQVFKHRKFIKGPMIFFRIIKLARAFISLMKRRVSKNNISRHIILKSGNFMNVPFKNRKLSFLINQVPCIKILILDHFCFVNSTIVLEENKNKIKADTKITFNTDSRNLDNNINILPITLDKQLDNSSPEYTLLGYVPRKIRYENTPSDSSNLSFDAISIYDLACYNKENHQLSLKTKKRYFNNKITIEHSSSPTCGTKWKEMMCLEYPRDSIIEETDSNACKASRMMCFSRNTSTPKKNKIALHRRSGRTRKKLFDEDDSDKEKYIECPLCFDNSKKNKIENVIPHQLKSIEEEMPLSIEDLNYDRFKDQLNLRTGMLSCQSNQREFLNVSTSVVLDNTELEDAETILIDKSTCSFLNDSFGVNEYTVSVFVLISFFALFFLFSSAFIKKI